MKRNDVQPIYSNTYRKLHRRYWFKRILIGLIIFLLIVAGFLFWRHQRQAQLNRFPVRGVALTQDAGFVDFQQVAKKNVSFVYLRATIGASYTDDQFQSGYDRAEGTNLGIGVFHVFSFTTSAAAQVKNFKNEAGTRLGQLPIALQVSLYGDYNTKTVASQKIRKRLVKVATELRTYFGHPVIIWCTASVWQAVSSTQLRSFPRWYTEDNPKKLAKQVRFVEYDPNGKLTVNGQQQSVAWSAFNGNKRQWQNYLQQLTN